MRSPHSAKCEQTSGRRRRRKSRRRLSSSPVGHRVWCASRRRHRRRRRRAAAREEEHAQLFEAGIKLMKRGEYKQAVTAFTRATAAAPGGLRPQGRAICHLLGGGAPGGRGGRRRRSASSSAARRTRTPTCARSPTMCSTLCRRRS